MKNLGRILQKKKRNKKKAGLPPKDQSRFGKNRHKKPDFTWLSWCVCFEFLRFWVPKLQRTCPLVVNSLRVEMSARHLGRSFEKKKWGWKFRQDPKLVGGWTTQLKKISQNGNLPQIGVKTKNIWNHHLENEESLRFIETFHWIFLFWDVGFCLKIVVEKCCSNKLLWIWFFDSTIFPNTKVFASNVGNFWATPRPFAELMASSGPVVWRERRFHSLKNRDLPKMCPCQAHFVKIFVDDRWCCYRNFWYCWWTKSQTTTWDVQNPS